MKKQLLSVFAFGAILTASAQTVLFEDNFDSYTVGSGVVAQNTNWAYWSTGTPSDANVSSDFAYSGANSANVSGTATDLVLPIGPYSSGKYDIKFKMYLPAGSGGYFNALHTWSGTSTAYQWAADVFFDGAGVATWTTGGTPGGAVTVGTDVWFDVQITADLDADLGRIYLNGAVANEWQWSLNNANGNAGNNTLAAIDFYGTNTAGGAGNYYIDDVQVIESTGVAVKPLASEKISKVSIYPNPTTSNFSIEIPESFVGGELSIIDLTGKIVIKDRVTQSATKRIDVSNLSDGIYLIRMNNGAVQYTDRLIKK
ncbi:MAG: hypothetical protein RI989_383 [Bacteroidota bacterium]